MQLLNSVSICEEFSVADGHSDSLCIELHVKSSKNIIVGVIYRPPDSDIDIFKINLEKLILYKQNK